MLCYSTASLPDSFSSTDIAEVLLPTVFRGVELVITPEHLRRATDASYWLGYRTDLETRGLRVRNVQLGHPYLLGPIAHAPGLSSLDPSPVSGRARRVEAALAAARIADWVGSGYLTVTTGMPEGIEGGGLNGAGDFGAQERCFYASLAEIVARRPKSIRIAIEQEPEHVIRSAEQVLGLCREFDGAVFSNYDVGHGAVLGEDPAAAVRLLGKYLSNIHLEDIRGGVHKHLLFGEGDIDFRALFAALKEIDYRGDLTPDLYPFKHDPVGALRASTEFLTQMQI